MALRPLEAIPSLLRDAGSTATGALHACRAYYGALLEYLLTGHEEFVAGPDEDVAPLTTRQRETGPLLFAELPEGDTS